MFLDNPSNVFSSDKEGFSLARQYSALEDVTQQAERATRKRYALISRKKKLQYYCRAHFTIPKEKCCLRIGEEGAAESALLLCR